MKKRTTEKEDLRIAELSKLKLQLEKKLEKITVELRALIYKIEAK